MEMMRARQQTLITTQVRLHNHVFQKFKHLYATGIQSAPRKRKKRKSQLSAKKRKISFERSKYYLSPDPAKAVPTAQDTPSKRVLKVQVTTTRTETLQTTTIVDLVRCSQAE